MVEVVLDPEFFIKKKGYEDDSSRYKAYRKKWNDNPKNNIIEDFPIHLDIEVNSSCNLRCVMCFQSSEKTRPKYGYMTFDLFKKIIDEGTEHGLCSIKPMFRGEPLLHPKIVEMMKYAKEKGVIEVMLNTNATLLSEEKARGLIEVGVDRIICSVDACSKELYEKIRVGAKFDNVLNNIKRLQELKKELGVDKPIVRAQMVDTPQNHLQIDSFVDYWGSIVDEVSVEAMYEWHNMVSDAAEDKDFCCAQLWQRLIILWDGQILLCCGDNRAEIVVGNAKVDNLSELWKSDKLKFFRELHLKGESHKMISCRRCGLRKSYINQKLENEKNKSKE